MQKVIFNRYWEQVEYLISANPRLADMMEVTMEQHLLHKVVLYGAGKVEVNNKIREIVKVKSPAAPESSMLSWFAGCHCVFTTLTRMTTFPFTWLPRLDMLQW